MVTDPHLAEREPIRMTSLLNNKSKYTFENCRLLGLNDFAERIHRYFNRMRRHNGLGTKHLSARMWFSLKFGHPFLRFRARRRLDRRICDIDCPICQAWRDGPASIPAWFPVTAGSRIPIRRKRSQCGVLRSMGFHGIELAVEKRLREGELASLDRPLPAVNLSLVISWLNLDPLAEVATLFFCGPI
jgi:hypothetical protein